MLLYCPYLGHEGALGIGRLVVSLFRRYLFAKSAVDDIGWGTDEMISDLDGSLESRYFLNVTNERTCFASCARSFQSSGLITWSLLTLRASNLVR